MHYYNENNPKAAAWLRELMNAGHIPQGHVDERSITLVSPSDLRGYTQCHFFAGIGGWPLALQLAGVSPDTPLWTGSCPCQPFSNAGKRRGTDDERHLWPVWARLIDECKPPTVFGEQVASKSGRAWLSGVRAQMETMGYAVGAADLCAAGISAPQIRQRLWWVGYSRCGSHERWQQCGGPPATAGTTQGETRQRQRGRDASGSAEQTGRMANSDMPRPQRRDSEVLRQWPTQQPAGQSMPHGGMANTPLSPPTLGGSISGGSRPQPTAKRATAHWADTRWHECRDGKRRRIPTQPSLYPLAHGLPHRVALLRGAGNAIVPQVAAQFIQASFQALQEITNH
jgi:DNA (cytosine-5)-methyltransferase 1